MKKLIICLLIAAMLLALCACSSQNGAETLMTEPKTEQKQEVQPSEEKPVNNPKEEEKALHVGELPEKQEQPQETEKPAQTLVFHSTATIEETVLVDEKDIRITATELTYSGYSADLKLMIENNSAVDLSFRSGTLGYSCNSVNGYMMKDGYLNKDVAAGKKAIEEVSFDIDELLFYGITEIADIEIGIRVTDDDYDEYFLSGPLHVHTSAAETYDITADSFREVLRKNVFGEKYDFSVDYFSEDVLYDQCGVRIVCEAVITNRSGGRIFLIEAENTGETQLSCAVGDITLNGLCVSPDTWTSEQINPGTRCILSVELGDVFDPGYYGIFGIGKLGSFGCSLTLNDADRHEICPAQMISVAIPNAETSFDGSGTELYSGNGVRIVYKGIVDDPSRYSDSVHILMVAENTSGSMLYLDEEYDSLSVNGFMVDGFFYIAGVRAGESTVLDYEISDGSLEDLGISSASEITEAEFTLVIRDADYWTRGKAVISVPVP